MMRIISKERIALCTQVEGTWGEIFAKSPIALQSRCKHVPINPFWHMVTVAQNARVFVWNRRLTERYELVKRRVVGNMQRDAWYWCQVRNNPPLGCLWRLWQSASTLTEPFHPDRNIFCWWMPWLRIPFPPMRWRPLRFIVCGLRKMPELISPRETQTIHMPTFQWQTNPPNDCFHHWYCSSGSCKDYLVLCTNDIPLQDFNLLNLGISNKVAYRDLENSCLAIGQGQISMPH